jgi:diguanylate cyclase (GGDEF)-like protein
MSKVREGRVPMDAGQELVADTSSANGRRLTSGLTTRLILAYVERERGPAAVARVLREAGLECREEELRNEDAWFCFETKIRLFEAAGEVLEDPDIGLHIGAAALDLNVAAALKLALRAFGTPRVLYGNVGRATGKFTWAHRFEVLELSHGAARLEYRDISGVGYHPLDCQYNCGLLGCAPRIFGLPTATIEHSTCALEGAESCVYDIRWEEREPSLSRLAVGLSLGTAAGAGLAALVAPQLLPEALALPALGTGAVAVLSNLRLRRSQRTLKAQLRDQREVAERLSRSLNDLVSDLRIDEVLAKIIANGRAAIGGKEFALLLRDGDGLYCRSGSGISPRGIAVLERWGRETPELLTGPLAIDELEAVPGLRDLAADEATPIGSLCAVPLVFRDERLGALVALAHGPRAFLPEDLTMLRSYAAQAAIALADARMVEQLERMAREDPLTGLLNHREFHRAVESELKRAKRYGQPFALALLDVDGFKRINDRYGHAEGDRVLKGVAGEIGAMCRDSDVACRVGGDEFGLVLPNAGVEEAVAVVERIRARLEGGDEGITVSYGISRWPEDGPNKDLLLLKADMSMYDSKRARLARRER